MRRIRIGTRDSELALWQAHTVQRQLEALGYQTEIVAVKSEGDIILDKPLYEMGIVGVFTKTLDIAMLQGQIDIAVHSMKDVPTTLPQGIVQGAVLKRANPHDILLYKSSADFAENTASVATIATSSLRRKAQWLHRFPLHTVENLRGNVNTRLQKLTDSTWDGAIFAAAGLERINKKPTNHLVLDWMLPAPAQGAMVVVVNEKNAYAREAVAQLNDPITELCTEIERQFLKTLEGGCTAPIGAYAYFENNTIHFKGGLFSPDGKEAITVDETIESSKASEARKRFAAIVLANGGAAIIEQFSAKEK
jgi:hydroxymethylbilane synthase